MEASGPLFIHVAPDPSAGDEHRLEVKVEYRGSAPVQVYRASLPWATVQSLVLVAVKLDALGTVIEQRVEIDDPSADVITLTPGQVLEGTVSLDDRFPALSAARRKRDVMVFWTWQLETVEGASFPRASGAVLLPQE